MDLKEWFELEGVKQCFIARKIGVSDAELSKILHKKTKVRRRVADQIVWITKGVVSYDDLDLATKQGELMSQGKRRAKAERAKKNES